MASTALSGDYLLINGDTNSPNKINVTYYSSSVSVVQLNGKNTYFANQQFKIIKITGGDAADTITIDDRVTSTLR